MRAEGVWRRQGDALRAAGGRPPHLHHPAQVSIAGWSAEAALSDKQVAECCHRMPQHRWNWLPRLLSTADGCCRCAAGVAARLLGADATAVSSSSGARCGLPAGAQNNPAPTWDLLCPFPTLSTGLGRSTSRRCCGSGSSLSGCTARWTAASWRRTEPAEPAGLRCTSGMLLDRQMPPRGWAAAARLAAGGPLHSCAIRCIVAPLCMPTTTVNRSVSCNCTGWA